MKLDQCTDVCPMLSCVLMLIILLASWHYFYGTCEVVKLYNEPQSIAQLQHHFFLDFLHDQTANK